MTDGAGSPTPPAPRWRLGFSRLPLRARLTAVYTALFAGASLVVLGIAYGLLDHHLHRTLPGNLADPLLSRIAIQLALALAGTTLIAIAIGWFAAHRVLRPIGAVTAAARRVSDERLDERLALGGPHDEVRELADTFDAMLERLSHSIDAQRRFVANASHELRTPLTAIRTEVDVTLGDPNASAAELRQMGERVLAGTDELDELLEALLVLARSQSGVDRRTTVDLAETARRALAAVPTPIADVELRVRADRAEAWGDEPLLRRLVANLLDNALRYNRPAGWVLLETGSGVRDGRPCATLRVANAGPLVPPADLERIGEPFERLARHGTGSGSGLGLSIVRSVVAAHGGSTRISAPAVGGLDVTVVLPGPTLIPA